VNIKAKVHSCVYCGNNPVASHFIHWYFESSNVFFTPLRQILLNNSASKLIKKLSGEFNFSLRLVRLGEIFGILKEQNDIQLCKVTRAKVLWQEAEKRNIQMSELLLFSKPFDCYIARKKEFLISNYQFPINSQIFNSKLEIPPDFATTKSLRAGRNQKSTIVFSGLPRPQNYNDSALNWMDDKWLFKKKLIDNQFPVPKGGCARNFSQAIKIFNSIEKPAIVKPRTGSRGRHSTIFVSSQDDLKKALKIAKELNYWAIIEEQLKGPVFRATLINFELCGVLRGDPPQVMGDGIQTIRELINTKNSQPHPDVKDIMMDEQMERFLSRQELRLLSVAEKGVAVNLSEKIGVNYGGSSSEDYEICHEDNKELFIRAAKVVGDVMVGFDFIIPDIAKSWRGQKCGFIEANSLPFINLHHDPLLGKPRDVAAKVWEMLNW